MNNYVVGVKVLRLNIIDEKMFDVVGESVHNIIII